MFKKIIFLLMLLFSIENQPFFTELFAMIGFVVCARSKPAQTVARFAWSKFKGSANPALSDFKNAQPVAKFAPGSFCLIKDRSMQAKRIALRNWSNLTAALIVLKNRLKNPVVFRSEFSQTVGFQAVRPGVSASSSAGAAASSGALGWSGWRPSFSNVYAQQNNFQQNNYGLFHWYGSKKSEEWAKEFGKKRFWQGAFGGSVFTAWLLKSSDRKKEDKN